MAQKVAGLLVKLSADSAELKNDLRQIKTSLRGFGRAANREANRVKYAFNKIRRAAQVVASAFIFVAGIRQLGNLVSSMAKAEDQVNLLEARFKQFARAGDSFTRVYNLSKELGVGLDATAEGMTRLLVATKEMGTAQSVLEDVHKNIVILGRAGGTSTEEMKGAMRQLSQGLASGRLQGEELRSVLENLPLVAMEISKQMGIGLGQIRKVAKEGKITGQVVIDALAEIGIGMEDLPQTWAMQTENLRTEWTLFLADLSKAVDEAGLLDSLVEAVKWVRINLLDSTKGISTPILRSKVADLSDQRSRLRRSLDDFGFNPDVDVLPPKPYMAPGVGGYDQNAGLRELLRQYTEVNDLIKEYNGELETRAKLEKFAADSAAARAALGTKAEMSQLLKEIPLIDAGDRILAMWKRINKNFEDIAETVKNKLGGAFKEFTDRAQEARTAIGRGITLEEWQAYRRMLKDDLIPELENVKDKTEEMSEYSKRAAQNMQDAFADFLFDPFEKGVKGMLEGFLTAIRRMIAEAAAARFFEDIGVGSFLGSLIGKRALGGPIAAGVPYLVGERGPEVVVPSRSGYVVPNSSIGGVTVINNIDARGADEARIMRVMPLIMDESKRQTIAEIIKMRNEGSI